MRTRQITSTDIGDFLQLFETVFNHEWATEEWFRWKYSSLSALDGFPVVVAEDNGTLIGAIGYLGFELQANNSSMIGIQPVDVMVHPNHRGQNTFLQLVREGRDSIYPDEYLEFGWPNSETVDIWTQLQQWEILDQRRPQFRCQNLKEFLSIPMEWNIKRRLIPFCSVLFTTWLAIRDHRQISCPDGYKVTRYDDPPVDLLSNVYQKAVPDRIHVVRSRAFYATRFANPLNTYTTYVAEEDGDIVGALVISEFVEDEIVKIAEVLPLEESPSRRDSLRALLSRVIHDYHDRPAIEWSSALPDILCKEYGFHLSEMIIDLLKGRLDESQLSRTVPGFEPRTFCTQSLDNLPLPKKHTKSENWCLTGIEKDTV